MIHKYFLRDKARILTRATAYEIFKGPHITEKTAEFAKNNRIVVKVDMKANKIDIKKAFEMIFEMPVENVNTIVSKPRAKMFKGKVGKKSPFKKAIIEIKKGVDISKIAGAL